MKSCTFRASLFQVITIAGAIAFAAPASAALAQGDQGGKSESSAAASKPNSVSGVIVPAPPKLNKPSPAKKAAFDAAAAKQEAWTQYRTTAPPSTVARARGGSLETENYPGLHEVGAR